MIENDLLFFQQNVASLLSLKDLIISVSKCLHSKIVTSLASGDRLACYHRNRSCTIGSP